MNYWHILEVKKGKLATVQLQLKNQEVDYFIPLKRYVKNEKLCSSPVFNKYLFFKCEVNSSINISRIKNTSGVREVLACQQKVVSLSDEKLMLFKRYMEFETQDSSLKNTLSNDELISIESILSAPTEEQMLYALIHFASKLP